MACVVVFLPIGLEVCEVGVVTHPDHAVSALQQSLLESLLPVKCTLKIIKRRPLFLVGYGAIFTSFCEFYILLNMMFLQKMSLFRFII